MTPIKTETATAAGGKKEMLTAIREYDLGLVQYQKLLDKLNAGADKDSLKATFDEAQQADRGGGQRRGRGAEGARAR